jgi:hypothetical protein
MTLYWVAVSRRRLIYRLLACVALAVLFSLLGGVLWQPENILWSHNAYGMAKSGAWTGLDAVWAILVYWFYALRGRTVVTMLMLVVWVLVARKIAKELKYGNAK